MAHTWDPEQYLTYADERGRPFVELVGRIAADAPATVVDLGCGPGTLTALLRDRWPDARIEGVDSSPEMIEAARRTDQGITFELADLRDWRPDQPVDVLVSNATLQWVPDHLDLLPTLLDAVRPGGWFACQVPGNFDAPSHTIRQDLAAEPAYAAATRDVHSPASHEPAVYLEALAALGCTVDVWETTYLHVLTGEDAVFTWVSGTGAGPTLQALPDELRPGFEAEFKRRLAVAYPTRDYGVVLPFRRIFVVARKPEAAR
ncbi:MAG: Trans-aconitate 2-methyltransferase [Nocardioides sp.]|nr:Trans-aconitate 2-methyltransferase [Nocardioides sp.]